MIETIIPLIVFFFLTLMMILDVKFKSMPSFLPTTVILLLAILNPVSIYFGILGLCFGLILNELGYLNSLYDIKIVTIIALTITTLNHFLIFMGLIVILGVLYQISMKIVKPNAEIIPYTPIYVMVYLIMELIKQVINI